jgi:hypothetical protein
MKKSPLKPGQPQRKSRQCEQASVRTIMLVTVVFLLGLAGGAYFYYRVAVSHTLVSSPHGAGGLSAGTKEVLKRLDAPVAIRFYSLLDSSVPVSLNEFAGRVNQLLAVYQQEANGRIKVTRYQTRSDSAEAAATADGIQAFNLDKGDACFLGLAIAHKDHKESLQLSPDWEAALESDLSRAIARVINPKPLLPLTHPVAPPMDPAVSEEVKRVLPNFRTTSMAEGTRILREKALAEFEAAAQEMEAQVKQAEQRHIQAQSDNSEAAQQAARRDIQRLRTEQTDKLKAIASRLQEQIAALEQLKKK